MKRCVVICVVALFSVCIGAQNKVARIVFKTTTIDYGTLKKGANGVRNFTFKNTGEAPLIIAEVKSTCGCTIPEKPKEPILPGASGVIRVKYDTSIVSPIRKTITVISNAETPVVSLKIKGEVVGS